MSDPISTKDSHSNSRELELSAQNLTDLLPPASGGSTTVDPPVRGEKILLTLEKIFLLIDRLIARGLPKEFNPFLQTGAIAMVSLLIATATGALLLLWYSPSVIKAYTSMAAMDAAPWTSGLIRSLHRYSSDMCLFFTLVHAIRLFSQRLFTGARWLAWVSGISMMGIIWLIGWTGYWLVWDERAQHLAVGTAKTLDVLPIFADPMGRTFLVNETVNSLLFFVIFFTHIMIPLVFGVATWFHLARVSRPNFLTGKLMSYWVVGTLLALSIFYPATTAGPANMAAINQSFTMDGWYLLPIALMDRLSGGALWGALLIASSLAFSIPWLLGRGRPRSAHVITSRCDACGNCYTDCPYNAITMVSRKGEQKDRYPTVAHVDPNLCIGCGICGGSCDTAGNGLPWFDVNEKRKTMRGWIKEMQDAGEKPFIALVCENSAAMDLKVDPQSGVCEKFPGYRVLKVPCTGWIHPLTIESLEGKGAEGVLIVSCGPGECRYREGDEWIHQRIDGERSPALRKEHADREKILILSLDKTSQKKMIEQSTAFQQGAPVNNEIKPSKMAMGFTATLLALSIACLIAIGSDFPYSAPTQKNSALVVTFRHPGQVSDVVKTLSSEELEALPVHMRQAEVRERKRTSVRMRISIDGQVVREGIYSPKGLWEDGPSVAVETIPVSLGRHQVEVSVGDGANETEWQYTDEKAIEFTNEARRVIIFNRVKGFSWY